jgi:hypothetical protein
MRFSRDCWVSEGSVLFKSSGFPARASNQNIKYASGTKYR